MSSDRSSRRPVKLAALASAGRAANTSATEDDDGFDRVGEIARQAVKEKVLAMLQPAIDLNAPDAQQAVLLGALAAVVECFVCAAREDVSRDRLKEALREVVSDFVDQAKDQLVAGIQ